MPYIKTLETLNAGPLAWIDTRSQTRSPSGLVSTLFTLVGVAS